jgi:hypothetical protein
MAEDLGGIFAGIVAVFLALVLVWAFYPVLVQLGGLWYGILFVGLALLIIIGAVIGLSRR